MITLCYNDCGRRAIGAYYIGRERVELCGPCMAEQDERDQEDLAATERDV